MALEELYHPHILMSSVIHYDTVEIKETIVPLQGFVEPRGHCDVVEPH